MFATKVFGIHELNRIIFSYIRVTDVKSYALTGRYFYASAEPVLAIYCEVKKYVLEIENKNSQIESLFKEYMQLVGCESWIQKESCPRCQSFGWFEDCIDISDDYYEPGRFCYQCVDCSYFEYVSDDFLKYEMRFQRNCLMDDNGFLVKDHNIICSSKDRLEDDVTDCVMRIRNLRKKFIELNLFVVL
jgi:hypothetical protein